MGFRKGSYAKVWEVNPVNDTCTKIRISTNYKNKSTNEYEQDFSGYVLCLGTAFAQKAAKLTKGDKIKLGDCDVTTKFDKEKKVTYTDFKLFSFDAESTSAPSAGGNDAAVEAAMDAAANNKLPF